MQAIPRTIVTHFAKIFAGKNVGFSALEITDYFSKYSNYVKPIDHYGKNPTRHDLFIDAVYSLIPKQQYYALNELAFNVQDSKYSYPNQQERNNLIEILHTSISPDPIGLSISKFRETAFREDWVTALNRVNAEPSAAITAARTMLETVLKTIINERDEIPDSSGNIQKLMKQAQKILSFDIKSREGEHQILSGISSIINGISSISNKSGDRHGTVLGKSIDDPYIANMVINVSAIMGLAFIEMHNFSKL